MTAPTLPLFISRRNRLPVGAMMFVVGGSLYLLSNHIYLSEPRLLPMSWVDLNVPFIPNTMWIYISEYIYFPVIYLICRDMANLNKYFYSFLSLQFISSMIFWFWPTTYPRDNYPLPADLNAVTHFVFEKLREADTPGSCCPSLHVSSVYLSSFLFLVEQRSKFVFFFIWGTLIALSTLTTKQHYIVDVITGLGMALVFYLIFYRGIRYREV